MDCRPILDAEKFWIPRGSILWLVTFGVFEGDVLWLPVGLLLCSCIPDD